MKVCAQEPEGVWRNICKLSDLQQVAVNGLSVQRCVYIHLSVGVVHRLDLKDILHVARYQGKIDLREG